MYDISVIVPTHNRRAFLPALLASLAAQDYPAAAWELVLVDDGSTDDTRAYLESPAGPRPAHLTCVFQAGTGAPGARNAGAAVATGRALLFLDDDMIAAPALVGEHARAHAAAPGPAVVVGHLQVPATGRDPWVAWEDAALTRHYARLAAGTRTPGPRDFFSGNCSVTATLFHAVGGYDTRLRRTEDVDLGYRLAAAGAGFFYRAAASSLHLGKHTFAGWLANARTYGRSEVQLAWEQGHVALRGEIFGWFHLRRPPTRGLIRLCSAFRPLEAPVIGVLDRVGRLAYRRGARRPAYGAYSAIYNLAYWLALSDALGREPFWAGVRAHRPAWKQDF